MYPCTVSTGSGKELDVGVGKGIEELGFYSTKFPSRKNLIVDFLLQIFFAQLSNMKPIVCYNPNVLLV